jgi:hypothetical protein
MKTFTATQLNKNAQQVFAAADKDGSVKINHDRYPGKVFIVETRERGMAAEDLIIKPSDTLKARKKLIAADLIPVDQITIAERQG